LFINYLLYERFFIVATATADKPRTESATTFEAAMKTANKKGTLRSGQIGIYNSLKIRHSR
jgi:hypothetical protein